MLHGTSTSASVRQFRTLLEAGSVAGLTDAQLVDRFLDPGRPRAIAEQAFAALVERHGPMVLGVCRRTLRDAHDADDAFQATFLVLVKKAHAISVGADLGPWLFAVALRTAQEARTRAAKRRAKERQVIAMPRAEPSPDEILPELREVLDEELGRLPERYRSPLVLCELEGRSRKEAAALLGLPEGTISSRLARGRGMLRERLARRGLAFSSGALAVAMARDSAATTIPAALRDLTVQAALEFAVKPITAGVVSASVAALSERMLKGSAATTLWPIAAVVLLAGGVTTAAVRARQESDPAPRRIGAHSLETRPSPLPAASQTSNRPEGREPAERFRLGNGLSVILRPVRGADRTALLVLYSVGGDHDPEGRSGLGHLLEHIYVTAAAGAEKARTAGAFSKRYPLGWNAQTGDRYTVIATEFPAGDLDRELRDASARMADLHVSPADLESERLRVLEEVENMFGRIPSLAALNNAHELIRPTPADGRRGGMPADIRSITLEDLQTHWKRYYKPRNAILVLAGALDASAARRAVSAHFAGLAPGEQAPTPRAPGAPKFGASRELTVPSPERLAKRYASIAYAAPAPDSALYAPFLVLAARLQASGWKLEGLRGLGGPNPVYFPILDDPAVLAVTTPARAGETAPDAYARLEAFVARTLAPKLVDDERDWAVEGFGFYLGTVDIPDRTLRNIYGVAFTLARRAQLGIDAARLKRSLQSVTDQDLRRASAEIFSPKRHAGAFVSVQD